MSAKLPPPPPLPTPFEANERAKRELYEYMKRDQLMSSKMFAPLDVDASIFQNNVLNTRGLSGAVVGTHPNSARPTPFLNDGRRMRMLLDALRIDSIREAGFLDINTYLIEDTVVVVMVTSKGNVAHFQDCAALYPTDTLRAAIKMIRE